MYNVRINADLGQKEPRNPRQPDAFYFHSIELFTDMTVPQVRGLHERVFVRGVEISWFRRPGMRGARPSSAWAGDQIAPLDNPSPY